MDIEATREEDWARLKGVRLRALGDSPQAFARTLAEEQAMTDDEWRRRANSTESSANFIATEGGRERGLVAVFHEEHDARLAHLVAMWVEPELRGHGVGASLVDAVLRWCKEHGASRVHLWVVESNEDAERLYRSRGFLPTGRRQPLPSDPALNELEMARGVPALTE